MSRSASLTSSRVALNDSINVCGSFRKNPTVSVRRTRCLFGKTKLRVVAWAVLAFVLTLFLLFTTRRFGPVVPVAIYAVWFVGLAVFFALHRMKPVERWGSSIATAALIPTASLSSAARSAMWRLVSGMLEGNTEAVARELGPMLGLSQSQACRIVNDARGEPMVDSHEPGIIGVQAAGSGDEEGLS